MRLDWKKYDSEFNPTVAFGARCLFGGVNGLAGIAPALANPVVWVFATIPLIAVLLGVVPLPKLERVPILLELRRN
jgi:hypothetical protein